MRILYFDSSCELSAGAWAAMYAAYNFVDPSNGRPIVPVGSGKRLTHVLSIAKMFEETEEKLENRNRKLKEGEHVKPLEDDALDILLEAVKQFAATWVSPHNAKDVQHALKVLEDAETVSAADLEAMLNGERDAEEKAG